MNTEQSITAEYEKIARVNTAFAFISLFLGYAFVRAALFSGPGIGVTVYVLLFVACGAMFMRLHGVTLSVSSVAMPAIMLVFSAVFVISGAEWVRLLTLLFEILAATYWFVSAFGCRAEARIGDFLPFDMIKAFFVHPFSSFFAQPRFAVSALKSTKTGRRVFHIIIGLALAVIPGAIITAMLVFADDAFENLINLLYDSFLWSVAANLLYFVIGLPVAMYIFGVMISASSRKCSKMLTKESCGRVMRAVGFVPPAVVYTTLTVILVIYALFFVAQSSYFLSAFASLKPEGFTYADYARRGFFELCRVATINAVLVLLSELFVLRAPKNGEVDSAGEAATSKPLTGLRVYNILMGLSTLILIAVAAAKLCLYIENYGLTPARVKAAWFMLLLTSAFIFLIIRQLAPKFNFWRACTAAFIVLFAVLAFSNTDTLIAKYNIARFYDDSLPTVDVELFASLSDSALPELAELLDRDEAADGSLLDEETRIWAGNYLKGRMEAEVTRRNREATLTERINYALGYNVSRSAINRLLESGKYHK
jgi:hypothetical protein